MKSAYDFFIRSTGKELEEIFQGMTRPIPQTCLNDFLYINNLVWEKDLIPELKFNKSIHGWQEIIISFWYDKILYDIEIDILFKNGVPKFGNFSNLNFNNSSKEKLYGSIYNIYLPISNYKQFVDLCFYRDTISVEDLVLNVKELKNEIDYWKSYYIDLFNSGKIIESYNTLFYQKFEFTEYFIKEIVEAHIRYLFIASKNNFDILDPEELWILYYYDRSLSHSNNDINKFIFCDKNFFLEEKSFRNILKNLISKRKEKVSIEKFYIDIQKEFYLEIMKAKQEISGKYGIDPGWLHIEFPDFPNELDDLPKDLIKSPYDIGYYKKDTMNESDTREGLNKIIEQGDV